MKKVKVYFRELPIPQKIQKAKSLVTIMGGNANFSSPEPALPEVSAAAIALENAYEEALNGGKLQIAFMHQCESVLDTLIVSLAGYVQSISRGDQTIILSSGFGVQSGRSQLQKEVTPPVNVSAVMGAREGEVSLSWDPVPGAKAYNIQVSNNGTGNWIFYGTVTRRRLVISGLESGAKCFLRVAAVGALGQSGWSDPGIARAL
jgi:hypothetical protein